MNVSGKARLILLLAIAAVVWAVPACKKASPPAAPLPPVAVAPKAAAPAAEVKEEAAPVLFSYSPAGHRDPFGSLLRVKKDEEGPPEEQLTPLQRVPVTDLKLEGIILMGKKAMAHVIAPDGKPYIVTVGTPMGRHKGKIVRIISDAVIVEEHFEDYLGRQFTQETVLKLREGEEESL